MQRLALDEIRKLTGQTNGRATTACELRRIHCPGSYALRGVGVKYQRHIPGAPSRSVRLIHKARRVRVADDRVDSTGTPMLEFVLK